MVYLTSKLITIVTILSAIADASRILAVFPHPCFSQQLTLKSLVTELARRGHEVITFTPNPANDSNLPSKYTEVDLHHIYNFTTGNINFFTKIKSGIWSYISDLYDYNEYISEETLSHPEMQRLISPDSTAKFDLIIVQNLYYYALHGLSVRFDAPLIVISTTQLMGHHNFIYGNPLLPATSPDMISGLDANMNLWQRFVNLYVILRQIYGHKYIVLPKQEKICRKYFGNNVPPVSELISRVSLIMVNTHPLLSYPRPNIPAIVHIGGFHVGNQKKKLPQDLKVILDDAKQGYIYFSLGTNLKSEHLPMERHNMFLNTFAKLPYKVLWKFHSDHIANKPENVIIRKWFPQQQVLAHPNIRLYIYQGGLHSTDEAIVNGVPLIGFPIFNEQMLNVNRMQHFGVGKALSITDCNEEELRQAILEVITNSSYKENMLRLRNLFRDLPYNPMDNAIWWIEHVIRHKGAPYLHSKVQDIPWYQGQMLDLMAIILGTITLVTCIIVFIIRYIFYKKSSALTKMKHDSKKKN